jgi:hypothetical protein
MSDPSMPSSNTGPHFPGQGPKPHPEFTQHVHHHSLFHPRAQMPGLGPAGPAATTFQPGYGHGYGHWHGGQHYRRFRGPFRLIWVGRLALFTQLTAEAETVIFVTVRARSRGHRLLLFPLATSCPVFGIFLPPELGLQERRLSSSSSCCQQRSTRLQRRCAHDVRIVAYRTTGDGCSQDRAGRGRSRTSDRQRVRSGFE